jgi:RNA polymerase sigma-70 factor (ECF subfamily)
VERGAPRYFRLAARVLGDSHEAEEMVQSAFLKFWQYPHKWDGGLGLKFSTWFYRVVLNLCLDFKRKQGRVLLSDTLPETDWTPGTEETLAAHQQKNRIKQLLRELPERQRTALQLCFYEGLSNQEAAEVMGLKLKALQSLLMRAKGRLKEQWVKGGTSR